MQKQNFKLYGFFYSSASWRVRIALKLKGIEYQNVFINLSKGEQNSDEYKQLNPGQSVPTLIHNDNILTESTGIIEYLDALYPDVNGLLPESLVEQCQVRSMCQVVNSSMQPLQNLRVVKKMVDDHRVDRKEWTLFWVEKGYQTLENMLEQHSGQYSFGDKITQADLFLYPQAVGNADRFGYDLKKHPNIQRVVARLREVEAFRLSEPIYQEDNPDKK